MMQNVEETQSSCEFKDVKTVEVDEASLTHSSSPEIEKGSNSPADFYGALSKRRGGFRGEAMCHIQCGSRAPGIYPPQVEGHFWNKWSHEFSVSSFPFPFCIPFTNFITWMTESEITQGCTPRGCHSLKEQFDISFKLYLTVRHSVEKPRQPSRSPHAVYALYMYFLIYHVHTKQLHKWCWKPVANIGKFDSLNTRKVNFPKSTIKPLERIADVFAEFSLSDLGVNLVYLKRGCAASSNLHPLQPFFVLKKRKK